MKKLLIASLLMLLSAAPVAWAIAPDSNFHPTYAGDVEAGHTFLWHRFLRTTSGIVTLTTTHGLNLTPNVFAGAGTGAWLLYYSGGATLIYPLYADVKLQLPRHRFSPFLDFKAGYLINGHSAFLAPGVGYRFALTHTKGISLSLATSYITATHRFDGLNLRLAFHF